MLDAYKIRPLYILDYENPLYDDNLSPHTDAGRAAFARFAAAAAAHFRGRGVIWEIWNEPNIGFWKPQPNADDYAALAIATAQAIHKADPGACVVAPGSSTFPWSYLKTLFEHGLLKYVDGVSVHPYTQDSPETNDINYMQLRQLIAEYTPAGQPQKPIICSEWGYSTSWRGGNLSPETQAQYMVREWLCNLTHGVNLSIYYDWKNDGLDPTNAEHNFGSLNADLSPKPAYLAAQSLIQNLRGYRFAHRLSGASPTQWRLLFIKDNNLAEADWNSDPNSPADDQMPHIRTISVDNPNYPSLLRAAEIEYTSAVIVPTTDTPRNLDVTVNNVEKKPAVVILTIGNQTRTLHIKSGQQKRVSFSIPNALVQVDSIIPVPVSVLWNSKIVSGLTSIRTAPIPP